MAVVRKPFIGQMDRIIYVYELVKSQNSIGEEKEEKKLIAKCWAKIDSDTGSEDVEGKVRHTSNKSFTIRWNRQIMERGTEFVLEYNKVLYSISHVTEIGRKSHLQLVSFNYV